mmetsp:Transcript_20018/g.21464  ORF Transcript_20018/g.21464 Transcript_20018/m.21464 type:complete len:138 (+) Transcript_20018:2-415(+)
MSPASTVTTITPCTGLTIEYVLTSRYRKNKKKNDDAKLEKGFCHLIGTAMASTLRPTLPQDHFQAPTHQPTHTHTQPRHPHHYFITRPLSFLHYFIRSIILLLVCNVMESSVLHNHNHNHNTSIHNHHTYIGFILYI